MNGEPIQSVSPADIGRWVAYRPHHAPDFEYGRIKSYNGHYVFVVYAVDDNWDNYQDFTAAATSMEQLYWFSEPGTAIICPRCNWVSAHPGDIENKYCAHCHMFHSEMEENREVTSY